MQERPTREELEQELERLRESEERFRWMFSRMAQGSFRQRADGLLLEVNEKALEMFGLTRDEFLGRTSLHPEWKVIREDGALLEGPEHPSMRALASGKPVKDVVVGVFHPEKKAFVWMSVNALPRFRRGEDKPCEVFVTLHDITDRKRAEEAYGTLCKMATQLICVADLATATFLQVNPAFSRLLGWTEEELVSRPFLDFVHPEDVQGTVDVIRHKLQNGASVIRFENRYRCKDGTYRWLSWNSHPIAAEGKTYAIAQDVTERRKTEQALRDMGEKLRLAMESAREGVWEWDLATDTLCFDDVGLAMLGYGGGEIRESGDWWFGQVHPEDRQRVELRFDDYLQGRAEDYRAEFRLRRKDGGYTWVSSSARILRRDPGGKPLACVGIHRDITERKAAEESLRISEEKFAKAFRASPDAFLLSLLPEGRLLEVNEGACRITGYTREEMLGRKALDLNLWESESRRKEYTSLLLDRGRVQSFEARFLKRDGQAITGLISGELVNLEEGLCALSVVKDISDRKKAEDALKKSEELLYEVGRIAQIGGWEMDLVTRKAVWTRTTYDLINIGYGDPVPGPDEHVSYYIEEDRPMIEEAMRALVEEGVPLNFEARIDVPGRGLRWFRALGRRVMEKGKAVRLYGTFQDITEAKRAGEELRKSEERLDLVLKGSQLGFWDWNLLTDEVQRNERWAEMLGYHLSDVEFTVRQWLDWIHPEDRDRAYQSVQDHIRGLTPLHRSEYRMLAKDGTYRWILDQAQVVQRDKQGRPLRMSGTHTDITDRKRAEEELAASERRIRQIIEYLPVGMAVYEAVDGGEDFVFVDMNPAGQRSSRVSLDEIRGKRLSRIFPAAGRMGITGALKEAVERNEARHLPLCLYEDRRISHWVENWIFPLPSGRVAALYEDRTGVVRLEEQLRHAQKMEAIGRLAGGVAHDFNNMLGVIMGHAELAMDSVDAFHPAHEDLKEIEKAARRSAELTGQLLAFARKQPIRPLPLDLNHTLSGMLKMLKRLIGEDISLSWTPGEGLWPVKMDPTQLNQILANLSINARDAINGVGTLSISTENRTFDREPRSGAAAGDYVLLRVSDTGCGLTAKDSEHIFEPFFTTKEQGRGTGLGLATVYGIVDQNRGFIGVESRPGLGATFLIHLPRALDEAEEEGKEEEVEAVRGSETILLVEDEPALLAMARAMLTRYGYRVLTARNSSEALELAGSHQGDLHLVLTDVVMPAMNGKELFERILALHPEARVLYMSGYSDNVVARHGVLEKGIRLIQKPFTVKGLAAMVRSALERD